MTKKSELSKEDKQVVADEAAAEVVYQHDLADAKAETAVAAKAAVNSALPYCTQQLAKEKA